MMNKQDLQRLEKRIPGKALIFAEYWINPAVTGSAKEITVLNEHVLSNLVRLCSQHGRDLQRMFEDKDYAYMSCFVDKMILESQFGKDEFFQPLFFHEKGEIAHYLISFPEIQYQIEGEKNLWQKNHTDTKIFNGLSEHM